MDIPTTQETLLLMIMLCAIVLFLVQQIQFHFLLVYSFACQIYVRVLFELFLFETRNGF